MPAIRVNVTVPPEILGVEAVRREVLAVLRRAEFDLKIEFQKTVTTWDENVTFSTRIYDQPGRMSAVVSTANAVYSLVNEGARPHTIRPRRARLLRFQSGYAPKSRPGHRRALVGGKFGDYVSASAVRHPGFEARKFDELIADDYRDKFEQDVQDAIHRAASG